MLIYLLFKKISPNKLTQLNKTKTLSFSLLKLKGKLIETDPKLLLVLGLTILTNLLSKLRKITKKKVHQNRSVSIEKLLKNKFNNSAQDIMKLIVHLKI